MKTHWLQNPNKNYLGHWDLPNGEEMTVTIKSAKWEEVKNPIINVTEAKRVIRFEEKIKPFICNQTNANSILKSTGIKFMEDAGGLKIKLYIGSIKERQTGDFIDCLRVKPEQIKNKLPELTSSHERWDGAKKAIGDGSVTIEQIEQSFIISPENIEALCSK